MLFEALYHLLNLDIPFFANWFSGSIFLLFGIYAVMFFFSERKNVLRNTIIFIISLFAWTQFQDLSGFILLGATFLTLNYLLKVCLIKAGESTPLLSGKLVLISEIAFIALLVVYNLGWFA